MAAPERYIVVDLDGTYYIGNTLHDYLRTAMRWHLAGGRFGRVFSIMSLGALRALRIISHRRFKESALAAAGSDSATLELFAAEAMKRINMPLQRWLREQESDCGVIMATAAPRFYARLLWPGAMVATEFDGRAMGVECRGEEKLARVKAAIGSGCIHTTVTDHSDDLPLMRESVGLVILVAPSETTKRVLKVNGIQYEEALEAFGGAR